MALSDLGSAADRIEGRIMNAFVKDVGDFDSDGTDETKYRDMGVIKDLTINLSSNSSDADVAGREKTLTITLEVQFVMQQTSANEFGAIQDITDPSGAGHTIVCTTQPHDTTAVDVSTKESFTFENVFPSVEGEINGSGEGSMFTVSFSGKVVPSDLAALPSTTETISIDA